MRPQLGSLHLCNLGPVLCTSVTPGWGTEGPLEYEWHSSKQCSIWRSYQLRYVLDSLLKTAHLRLIRALIVQLLSIWDSHISYSKWNSLLSYLFFRFWESLLLWSPKWSWIHVNASVFWVCTCIGMLVSCFALYFYFLRKSLVVTFSRLALNLEPFCLNSQVLGLPVSVPGLNSVLNSLIWSIKPWTVSLVFVFKWDI